MKAAQTLRLGVLLAAIAAPAAAKVAPFLQDGVALQGYDAVAYVDENRALPGLATLTARAEGAVYRFASPAHRAAFVKDTTKYIPAYGGWCAYAMARGQKVEVNPHRFKVVQGRLMLFYDGWWGDTLRKWNKNEKPLLAQADAWWKKLN